MSKATKRKYVIQEIYDMSLPTGSQSIVKIMKPCGNNLHKIVNPAGEEYLVSMPTKYRKNIWIKRGDYVLSEPIQEGNKVKGEIVKILTKDHIKWYRAQNCWPREFDEDAKENSNSTKEKSSNEDDDLYVNTNRLSIIQKMIEDSSSSDS